MLVNAVPVCSVSLQAVTYPSDPVTGNGRVLRLGHKTRVQGSSHETSEENFRCPWKSSARYHSSEWRIRSGRCRSAAATL